jgi:hypothetical protein
MAMILEFNRRRRSARARDGKVVGSIGCDGGAARQSEPEAAPLQSERHVLVRRYKKHAFSGTRRGRRLFREIESWLLSDDDVVAVPFKPLCELLEVDPERIRRHLSSWRSANAVCTPPRRGGPHGTEAW